MTTRRRFLAASAAAMTPRFRRRGARPTVDVAIIGGGIAGLVAATDLAAKGADVVVLEARDRVGGRTLNQVVPGTTASVVEAGGGWIAPGHDAILDLAERLGVGTFPVFATGRAIGFDDRVTGSSAELGRVIAELAGEADGVPLESPWTARTASQADSLTVAAWLDQRGIEVKTKQLVAESVRELLGGVPEQVSLLWWLFYLKSNGVLQSLDLTTRAAEAKRVVGGAATISTRLADKLAERVRLSSPVGRIRAKGDVVEVQTRIAVIEARYAIIAMSPRDAVGIRFDPGLPLERRQLMEQWRMGRAVKAHLVYRDAFWRADGLSGISRGNASVALTYDDSPADGRPGVLAIMINELPTLPRPIGSRRAVMVDQVVKALGPRAAAPIGYSEHDWSAEPWNAGCHTALPPYVLLKGGPWLRRPIGRIHWAGTETASQSNGSIDGAVRSGHRAALEVSAG